MSHVQETMTLNAVMYSDGGCRPSRGIGGYGFHGYTYLPIPQKTGSGCKNAQPTDQGYVRDRSGNMEITPVTYLDGFGPLIPEVTNNYAELVAAEKALTVLSEYRPKDVLMLLDSQYVIQGLSGWTENWSRNNWIRQDGTPVPNTEQWKTLIATKQLLEDSGTKIQWRWVKGHSGGESLGNDIADAHATRGIVVGRNILSAHIPEEGNLQFTRQEAAKGYWNQRVDKNRLINHPKWYFTQDEMGLTSRCGRHVYYFGTAGDKDDLIGRRSATASYSVIYLSDPDPFLMLLREATRRLGEKRLQGPMRAHLDCIFKNDVLRELELYGCSTLKHDVDKQRLLTYNDDLLVEEVRPAGLIFRGFDHLNYLQKILDAFIHKEESVGVVATPITTHLYETIVSKKKSITKLRSSINNSTRSLKLENIGYKTYDNALHAVEIPITIGIDVPDRNTLAALADDNVQVTVLTWMESPKALRYATVIETKRDIGIWSGIYSNLRFLTS